MSKLSFTTMAAPGLSAVELAGAARRYGYSGVDLRISDYMGELTLDSTPKEINGIKSAFLCEGIQVSGLLCYNEQGGKQDDSWAKMHESILRHLEIACMMGSPSIRIFGGNPDDYKLREDFISKTAEVVSEALQKANYGICVLIQNHKSSFTALEVAKLVKMVDSPFLRMAFSPDHSIVENENMESLVSELKSVTGQLYVADVIQIGNEFRSILPGKGIVPVHRMYEVIGGSSFEGWITFKWEKIWDKELEEPETALPYFIEYFKNLEVSQKK